MIRAFWSTIATLICTELLLRLYLSYFPSRLPLDPKAVKLTDPILVQPHGELGWINKRGAHILSILGDPNQTPQTVSIDRLGFRATSPQEANERGEDGEIVVIGCSFSYGTGLSDGDTYAALLAQKFPSFHVLNAASPGYGTYQALLTLDRIAGSLHHLKYIVYGFPSFHEVRNVAAQNWLYYLNAGSRSHDVKLPFVVVGKNGELIRREAIGYSFPAVCDYSKILCMSYLSLEFSVFDTRLLLARSVTEALLEKLKEWAAAHDAKLIVVTLDREGPSPYRDFLESKNFLYTAVEPNYPVLPHHAEHPAQPFHVDAAHKVERLIREQSPK